MCEAALVRDILYVFQGIDGRHVKRSSTEDAYRVDGKVLRGLLESRALVPCPDPSSAMLPLLGLLPGLLVEVPRYPHEARCFLGGTGWPAGVGYWVDPAEPELAPELLCPHRRA